MSTHYYRTESNRRDRMISRVKDSFSKCRAYRWSHGKLHDQWLELISSRDWCLARRTDWEYCLGLWDAYTEAIVRYELEWRGYWHGVWYTTDSLPTEAYKSFSDGVDSFATTNHFWKTQGDNTLHPWYENKPTPTVQESTNAVSGM